MHSYGCSRIFFWSAMRDLIRSQMRGNGYTTIRRIFMQLIEGLRFRVVHVGQVPFCNIQRHRAPRIGRFCFPLCWRCTSILGTFLGCCYLLFPHVTLTSYWVYPASAILMIPTTIDGVIQYACHKESTNQKRIVTGILAGIGLFLLKRLHLP